ncbi:hypothetical protein I0Y69_21225 [Serratia ureilytica]|nr:hypothetical protein [Serratia ureilytica]MBF8245979.1 hypothetical protein [Serratia ureilytica]
MNFKQNSLPLSVSVLLTGKRSTPTKGSPEVAANGGGGEGAIGAYLKRDKKLRLVFEDGKVKELDSSNYKPDELVEAINKIKEIDISR